MEERIRDELNGSWMEIAKDRSFFDHIDSFVALSRENTSVNYLHLHPFDSDPGNYDFWDKVGQMVGNLLELQTININFENDDDVDGDEDESSSPDWEILTRILRHVQRKVSLCSSPDDYDAEVEEIQGLARAIHGHPMI
jgi:hypothetical protein